MIIDQDRTELDQALDNERLTVLLLAGTKESKAGEVHGFAITTVGLLEDFYRCFLLTDLSILTMPEKNRWFTGDEMDRYAVVGGKESPKRVGKKGAVDDLLRIDRQPSKTKIRLAFAKGNQL
jgi:hypothetical protein